MGGDATNWRSGTASAADAAARTPGVPAGAAADEAEPTSRGRFLAKAVLAAGAAGSGAVLLGSLAVPAASAPSPEQDVRILNFLLLLEYLQERLYAEAEAAGRLKGELLRFARVVGEHEREHIEALRSVLGADARSVPELRFGDAVQREGAFAAAALTLEETAAAGYIGQAANLTTERIPDAARIVAVEARHAAWIRDVVDRSPAPNAADPPKTPAQVRETLNRTGFVVRS